MDRVNDPKVTVFSENQKEKYVISLLQSDFRSNCSNLTSVESKYLLNLFNFPKNNPKTATEYSLDFAHWNYTLHYTMEENYKPSCTRHQIPVDAPAWKAQLRFLPHVTTESLF